MKFFCLFGVLFFSLFLPKALHAQTLNHFSGWLAAFGTVNLNPKFSLHLEGNLRSSNEWERIQTWIFRTGLNFKLKSNQTVTLGYAYISNHRSINGINGYIPENRIWEQYSNIQYFTLNKHYVSLQNRIRLEQRFIGRPVLEQEELAHQGFEFAQRFRYFFRAIVPMKQNDEKLFKKGAYFSLQNEVFLNVGDNTSVNGKFFDQNRAYISLGYRFSPKNDTEIGYMYQYVSGRGSIRTRNNILQLATYFRL